MPKSLKDLENDLKYLGLDPEAYGRTPTADIRESLRAQDPYLRDWQLEPFKDVPVGNRPPTAAETEAQFSKNYSSMEGMPQGGLPPHLAQAVIGAAPAPTPYGKPTTNVVGGEQKITSSIKDPLVSDYMNRKLAFEDAQNAAANEMAGARDEARQNRMTSGILSALAQGSATATGAKYDPSFWQGQMENANAPIEDIKAAREAKSAAGKAYLENEAVQKIFEDSDPNSETNKRFQAAAKPIFDKLGIQTPATLEEFKKFGSITEYAMNLKKQEAESAKLDKMLAIKAKTQNAPWKRSEQEFKSLPKETQVQIEDRAKKIPVYQESAAAFDSIIKQMDDPAISDDQKIQAGLNSLKQINSTLGPDALSSEEAERASSYLNFATGLNPTNPRGMFEAGRDLNGFKTQMKILANRARMNAKAAKKDIESAYSAGGVSRGRSVDEFSDDEVNTALKQFGYEE